MIAGIARGRAPGLRRATARGRSATGSSRRLFAILEPELRGRAVPRPVRRQRRRRASRRCRAVPARRSSSSAIRARSRHRAQPRRTGPRRAASARRRRSQVGDVVQLGADGGRAVRRHPRRPAVRPARAARSTRSSPSRPPDPAASSRPMASLVAKHFWKTPPPAEIGLLRSARERRFGETTLTFLPLGAAGPGHEEDG